MSRSPSPYCIFSSNVAQSVSSGFPRGVMGVSENNPSHFIPEMIRCFSSAEGNFVFDEIVYTKSLHHQLSFVMQGEYSSLDDLLPKTLAKASFHVSFDPGAKKSHGSSDKKPISTKTLTNSGNPWYLKVPRTTVCASGIAYASLYPVESRLAYPTNAKAG